MTELRNQVQKFYNNYHSHRLRSPEKYQIQEYWSFFQGSVLEIGAGRWLWPSRGDSQYTVVEISDVALELAIRAGTSGVLADGVELPFHDRAFSTVACHDVLEHVSNPVEFIVEMARVSGHYILIAGPNYIGTKIPDGTLANLFQNALSFLRGVGREHVLIEDPHLVFDELWVPDADAISAINAYWVSKSLMYLGFQVVHLQTWGSAAWGCDWVPILKYLGPFMIVVGERHKS